MKVSLAIFATLCLVFFGFQQFKMHSLQKEIKQIESKYEKTHSDSEKEETKTEEEHYELALAMARMQTYMQKLHFAGQHENWKLAQFYTHELEETMEDIIDHNVVDEGKDISNFVKTMAFPNIEKLEKTIKSEDKVSFVEGYQLLLRSCNNCHTVNNHEFIKIITPKNEDFINQDFR
ncbi:hypothetical protein Fleli_3263 [Bernardetia litoralis DSM 6794]|uniref:Cytochrome c domain-containing protein n=1 Tax=Bernardetia litoralis (strain ATCC 23117 / DSM 6794 / NBRC 15988 / NCIMB 1366 / Fx l1 / Sio-4) TaxID=880071 RepID=I4ANQ8_BERLS|nr:hypothetical protein [Bernardetia litoralis]AFM05593.1 hypothetical protein Fleli_3263 [Bernardetia litoralis DSM 6794]